MTSAVGVRDARGSRGGAQMSMPPHDGWQPRQSWGSPRTDPDQPYGQPFDPSSSNPHQQPPPPGWEHGAWTQHAGSPPKTGIGRTRLLVALAVLIAIAIAVVIATLVNRGGSTAAARSMESVTVTASTGPAVPDRQRWHAASELAIGNAALSRTSPDLGLVSISVGKLGCVNCGACGGIGMGRPTTGACT